MAPPPMDFSEESGFNKEETSIKQIVIRHIKKISDICAGEWQEGWWEMKPIALGGTMATTRIRHPDTREAYCNAVDFLIDVLYPNGDSKFKNFIDEVEKEGEPTDVMEKLKFKRKIFKEINKMFERANYFKSTDSYDE